MNTNIFNEFLIGSDAGFQSVLNAASLIAATDVAVMIKGESGTGKDLMAKAIHLTSRRSSAPFVAINCAAIPESLLESELFGFSKGAFTGADTKQDGRIAQADGGTLFLDEIGELPSSVQAKLLRFLESGEIQALGGQHTRKINVRVIAASNQNLELMVEQGVFRPDLFYRLNVVPVELPALRERRGDIVTLLEYWNQQLSAQHNLPQPRYHKEALDQLKRYDWPGNVRELRNFCERMLILFSGREILASNLPREFSKPVANKDGFVFTLPASGISLDGVERELIQQALDNTLGNRSRAARLLGISRDTLLYRMKKYCFN